MQDRNTKPQVAQDWQLSMPLSGLNCHSCWRKGRERNQWCPDILQRGQFLVTLGHKECEQSLSEIGAPSRSIVEPPAWVKWGERKDKTTTMSWVCVGGGGGEGGLASTF